ncbi:efflux RND transporter periplasmic adaptor subunit [Novipirellula artificiosorum]|uniref:Putative efflux pump membrane fusion protein n=1 Tax=Novipirellula artificiosorum TaxID=2528016 RepID=A0A5C6DFX7_9BACT|nr:HlyD family efflux transporter periplasmic adaptor subunit [Novipirellula artificiosorum]TWU35095.1 putative efflux pump membrane fusion protein [Novipirellula artificiosorum]
MIFSTPRRDAIYGFLFLALMAYSPTLAQPGTAAEKSSQIEIADAQVSYIQNAFIASPIAAVVRSIDVAEGDQIEQGRLLVQLDDSMARTECEAAVAAMEAAKIRSDDDVDARYARRALDFHIRELQQSEQANVRFAGAVSDSEVEKLRLVVDQAKLAIEQAEHEQQIAKAQSREKEATVQIAEQRVAEHAIRSSVAGVVVEITPKPGEWVDAGKPVVRVISLDPIRIDCFIDGRKYGPDLVNREVQFFCSEIPHANRSKGKAETFLGKVVFVSPELHPVTGQVRLWATVANPNHRLQSGMRGKVVIGGL